MKQLELIWTLEKSYKELENLKKKQDLIKNDSKTKNLEIRVVESERKLNNLRDKLMNNKKKLKTYEKTLMDYTYKINNIDKDLYDGSINDLKQLDYLSKEKEKIKDLINNLENEALILMEDIEIMELDIDKIHKDLEDIKKEIAEGKKLLYALKIQIEEKINKDLNIINELTISVDKNILSKYNSLRISKNNGIVEVKNYVCGGCNMHVPTNLGEALKNKNEIIYCESCGRILYYVSDDKEMANISS